MTIISEVKKPDLSAHAPIEAPVVMGLQGELPRTEFTDKVPAAIRCGRKRPRKEYDRDDAASTDSLSDSSSNGSYNFNGAMAANAAAKR